MQRKGINYDVGTSLIPGQSSREQFAPAVVRCEMAVIRQELHCTAVRIVGQDLERLVTAAECACEQGLEVWLSPAWIDASPDQTLRYFAECAQAAERLRQSGAAIVFVCG